mmetsp:Transcript_7837/g.12466  ORF Transcript_7837/g.12466 Transcript_7837/m.12466 type:complete len:82 (-) Transcript_7837:1140-1385(-)
MVWVLQFPYCVTTVELSVSSKATVSAGSKKGAIRNDIPNTTKMKMYTIFKLYFLTAHEVKRDPGTEKSKAAASSIEVDVAL